MDGIKGENGQHAFLLLEEESKEGSLEYETKDKPDIEIKELASILQKDELFQEYMENNRRKVQSAFQLPDLYVGYTTDFNRATAQTAQEVTEHTLTVIMAEEEQPQEVDRLHGTMTTQQPE